MILVVRREKGSISAEGLNMMNENHEQKAECFYACMVFTAILY